MIGSTKMAPIEAALRLSSMRMPRTESGGDPLPQMGPMTTMTASGSASRKRWRTALAALAVAARRIRLSLWPAATNTIPGRALTTAATRVRTGWPVQPGLTKPVPATDRLTTRQPCAELTIAGQPRLPMPAPAQPLV